MGLLATPDGTCTATAGVACWYAAIPAQAPDPSQWDNSHGGSGFMLDTLDYHGQGDTRIAVFDWTGLSALNSPSRLARIKFGGHCSPASSTTTTPTRWPRRRPARYRWATSAVRRPVGGHARARELP